LLVLFSQADQELLLIDLLLQQDVDLLLVSQAMRTLRLIGRAATATAAAYVIGFNVGARLERTLATH